ncbi:N-acetylmuramoyl-L-alanine amidase [Membranicola marinus]|uniref:N-acetylmuramoyl-L-alanine amidase n=1 Tax=Membranihabitans marinus TaxID=1227546 RepID=A0A953HUU2_9BACT|nr:N-acetylmuramoyl-L-alanine amidase [Membranihabitans marinus]MBY5958865.1 N-acetylmuramoyl-L-alanine amidase [Membranihabitans marinus]
MSLVNFALKCKTIFLIVLSIGLGINISFAHMPFGGGGGDHDVKKNADKIKKVVLDAGHGGKDSGALGSKSKEKDVVLDLVLKLGQEIERKYPDIEVIYTRKTDKFVELHERAEIANKANADLFISIHCNAAGSHSACGSETFVLGLHRNDDNLKVAKRENAAILLEENYEENYEGFDPNSEISHIILNMYQNTFLDRSLTFANSLETNLVTKNKRKSRGVKQAGFLVLRHTFMPSILFEAGFLTNKEEEQYLNSSTGQSRIIASFIDAFEDYRNQIENNPHLADVKTDVQSAPGSANNPTKEIKHAPHKVSQVTTTSPRPSESSESTLVASVNNGPELSPAPSQNPMTKKQKEFSGNELEFCVQLAATPKKANLSASKWRNIQNLSIRYEKGMYKYQITGIEKYSDANKMKDRMKQRGFEGAFVVAYNNGNRVDISEAVGMSDQ